MSERYGHEFFYEQTQKEEELHSRKNHDYARGGNPLGNFTRVASILSLYPNLDHTDPVVVAIVYALKQWDAALWMLNNGHSSVTGEGLHERFQDVSIYSKLARCLLKDRENVADNHDTAPSTMDKAGVRKWPDGLWVEVD